MAAARTLWGELAGRGEAFDDGVTVVVEPRSQLCPEGFVGVVSIGAGVLATVPTQELAAPVTDVLTAVPVREATAVTAFEAAFDVRGLLGPAALAYVDAASFRPAPRRQGWRVEWVEPGSHRLTAFLAASPPEEAAESGLVDATSPVALLLDHDDVVITACGWRPWLGRTAHLGILTAPHARGRGAGRAGASAAVARVLAAGLLPQWRARVPASRRVASTVGFIEVGSQLSLQITPRRR